MAGEEDLLSRVQVALAGYDEAALTALASRGLLRRAKKDLAAGAPSFSVGPDAVEVRIGSEIVRVGEEGPSRATCTCPARSACRHLLAAILHLRQTDRAPPADPAVLEEELSRFDEEALLAWGKKRVFQDAIAVLRDNPEPRIEVSDSVRVFFPESLVEVTFFAGAGLNGALTTARIEDPRPFVVAAVLAFRRSRGEALMLDRAPEVLGEAKGAPRSRSEVLTATRSLLEEMAGAGLVHAGESASERLSTLSISALGVNLPRLSLELRRAADEVRHLAVRRAQADEGRLFDELSRTYALVTALERAGPTAPAELIGWHRTRYLDVGTIELIGLGAWVWRTRSGFAGLTLLFQEASSGEWLTWSEARPEQHGGAEAGVRAYRSGGPWQGMSSPYRAARSRFSLYHAKKSRAGRLSGSAKTTALVTGPSEVGALDLGARAFSDFEALRVHAEEVRGAGLVPAGPLSSLVVATPSRFLGRRFDEIEQRLVWTVEDAEGRTLDLVIANSDATSAALSHVESMDPTGVWGVLGRVRLQERRLVMTPFAFYRQDEIVNLGLDAGPAPAPAESPASPPAVDEAEAEEEEEEVPIDAATLGRIRSLESILEELAESGWTTMDDRRRARLRGAATNLDAVALPILAKAARRLAEAEPETIPARLLSGRYLTGVHRRLAT